MKSVAILQSNYIPWKGYFDLINYVDIFVIYDEVQYTKRDWRNRNKIKNATGLQWLTIPCQTKNNYFQRIKDVKISNNNWEFKHWKSILLNYKTSKYFPEYEKIFFDLYFKKKETYLSNLNIKFIKEINKILGIKTKIIDSTDVPKNLMHYSPTLRLLEIVNHFGGNKYVSGPSAKSYFDEKLASKKNVEIEWFNYDNYKEYNQLFKNFTHEVSILDLIFNEGSNSNKYMLTF